MEQEGGLVMGTCLFSLLEMVKITLLFLAYSMSRSKSLGVYKGVYSLCFTDGV